jgi:hypothetical protein
MMMYPISAINAKENKQLDVVLVLDQSGSMKKNDPNGLMKEAAKTFITMLPLNSRANIITFNRKRSKWQNSLTDLSSSEQIASATNWIDNVKYTGDTDVGNAVSEAVDMFDLDDGRVHAILVFSDGRNDFGIEKNKEKESDENLSDALVTAKNSGIQIYCIGYGSEMSDTSDTPYKKLDSIAIANSDNRITTQTDAESIGEYFNLVLAELMDSQSIPIIDNTVEIASNVKEANINITSSSKIADANIKLIGPDGNEINFDNNDSSKLFTYEYSAVIKLYKPTPGTYTIQTNKNVVISATYIPYYEYTLKSSILNSQGNEITTLNNGETATIKTIIQQDDQNITTADTYSNVTATAVVTAKDTKQSQTIQLSYVDNSLTGTVVFDHVATYSIEIKVESDTFQLSDVLEIQTSKRAISINSTNQLAKQVLDKTFKKSVTKVIPMNTLNQIIEDSDNVGFEISKVETSDSKVVTVNLTSDGLELVGTKWGSSSVTVTYEDKLGNSVDSSFTVKVTDKALLAFFAALPVLIGLVVVLIVFLVMRKSRLIRGNFTINEISIEDDMKTMGITTLKTYPSNVFLMRKKTLANGIIRYAEDVHNPSSEKTVLLYTLMNQDSEIKQALESVKFVGTYLGRNGCKIVIKHPNVSYGNNSQYGRTIKDLWKNDKEFTIYVKDSQGLEIAIHGHYSPSMRRKKKAFDENMDMFNDFDKSNNTKKQNDDFDDFDF